MYPVEEIYDEKSNEWIYKVTMPVEDKAQLERICEDAGYTISEVFTRFIEWVIDDPNNAVAWLREN